MAVQDPTAANVSLWTHYFDHEWGAGRMPHGPGEYVSRAAAAAVGGWLTTAAPRIADLYRDNLAALEGARAATPTADEPAIPSQFRRPRAAAVSRTDAGDAKPHRRHYERRTNTSVGASSAATSRSDTATTIHRGGGHKERPGSQP
jgi:hypothetical protein